MSPVRKLAFVAVRTQPSLGEVFAQGAFDFGVLVNFKLERVFERFPLAEMEDFFFSFGGDFRGSLVYEREVLVDFDLGCHGIQKRINYNPRHVIKEIKSYSD